MYQASYRNAFADPANITDFQADVWEKLRLRAAFSTRRLWFGCMWSECRTNSNAGPLLEHDLEISFRNASNMEVRLLRWEFRDVAIANGVSLGSLHPAAGYNRQLGGAAGGPDDFLRPLQMTQHADGALLTQFPRKVAPNPDTLELFDEFTTFGPNQQSVNLVLAPFTFDFEFVEVLFKTNKPTTIYGTAATSSYFLAAACIG